VFLESLSLNSVNCVDCVFQELKLKDEECGKLLKVRDQMGMELEELTASLFEVRAINHQGDKLIN
jgi:hypothetical protein